MRFFMWPTHDLHMQAAQHSAFVPMETTVWEYIAHNTDNPDFAKAVKALKTEDPAYASRGRSPAGKFPMILHNMCASCKKKKTATQPGQLNQQTNAIAICYTY